VDGLLKSVDRTHPEDDNGLATGRRWTGAYRFGGPPMSSRRPLAAAVTLSLCLIAAGSPVSAGVERVDVLIQFASPPTGSDEALVHSAGGEVTRHFSIVPAVAATVPAAAVDALARNPRVTLVEPDSLVYALDYRSTHDWGIGHINADDVHRQATPNHGAGMTVAVLDSGIDCDHLELPATRCDYGQGIGENFVAAASHEAANEADDDYGHGTHVAGTIAASLNGANAGVVGVAPGATLVSLKTLDSSGVGAWSRHIAAIDHVWNGGDPLVDIVNMSIGRGDYSSTAELAMQRAYDSGILLVAAAGNSGRCSGRGTNVAYPALFASVIAVAAVDAANERPCWSSTGDKVELAAPGVSVFSTWPSNMASSYLDPQPVCEDGDGNGSADCHYKYGSGTSMSAPHVSGAAALVLASGTLADANGNGLADELRARLAATTVDIGASGRDPQYGYGVVDAAAASGASVAPPPEAALTLSVTAYKVRGRQHADLEWSGAASTSVDVWRNDVLVATTANDGFYTDAIGATGGGTYTYQVCEASTTTCSNEAPAGY
jgi:subtilisin family serine protease